MKSIACVIGSLAVFGQVQGHGGVYNYTIGKTSYAGHYPWLLEDQQPESIQRRWWPDPIQDVNHPYLSCNRGNPLAKKLPTLHAPIEAGTNITAHYLPPKCPPGFNQPETALPYKNEPNPPLICSGSEYSWPHASGPLITYMAACNGPCDQFDPSFSPVWFKIYENGFTPGKDCWVVDGEEHCLERDIGGTGFAQYLLRQGWSVQIPKNLKPGNYLIRHEVIMIELMPPQFYPECAQLTVTGSGDKFPSEDYLVSFPGAYSLEDPGLAICGDIYSPKGHSTRNYTVPGPKVWTGDE